MTRDFCWKATSKQEGYGGLSFMRSLEICDQKDMIDPVRLDATLFQPFSFAAPSTRSPRP